MWNCFSFTCFIGGFARHSLYFFYVFIIIIISTIKPNKPYTYNVWPILYELMPTIKNVESVSAGHEHENRVKRRENISNWTWNALIRTYLQLLVHVPPSFNGGWKKGHEKKPQSMKLKSILCEISLETQKHCKWEKNEIEIITRAFFFSAEAFRINISLLMAITHCIGWCLHS